MVDGIYGPHTRAAIREYQHDLGLPADGRITTALAEHLDDSSARMASRPVKRHDDLRAGPPRSSQAAVPPSYLPPRGYCRIWFDQRPLAHQPPPAPCHQLVNRVPPGARLVFGPEAWPPSRPAPTSNSLFTALTGHGGIYGLTDWDRETASSAYARVGAAHIGEAIEWNNPRTGNRGRIVALRDGVSSRGRYCREFSQSVTIAGRRQQAYSVACQRADGSWQLASK